MPRHVHLSAKVFQQGSGALWIWLVGIETPNLDCMFYILRGHYAVRRQCHDRRVSDPVGTNLEERTQSFSGITAAEAVSSQCDETPAMGNECTHLVSHRANVFGDGDHGAIVLREALCDVGDAPLLRFRMQAVPTRAVDAIA